MLGRNLDIIKVFYKLFYEIVLIEPGDNISVWAVCCVNSMLRSSSIIFNLSLWINNIQKKVF